MQWNEGCDGVKDAMRRRMRCDEGWDETKGHTHEAGEGGRGTAVNLPPLPLGSASFFRVNLGGYPPLRLTEKIKPGFQ